MPSPFAYRSPSCAWERGSPASARERIAATSMGGELLGFVLGGGRGEEEARYKRVAAAAAKMNPPTTRRLIIVWCERPWVPRRTLAYRSAWGENVPMSADPRHNGCRITSWKCWGVHIFT